MGAYYEDVTDSTNGTLLALCAAGLLHDRTPGEIANDDAPMHVSPRRSEAPHTFLDDRGSGWRYYVVVED